MSEGESAAVLATQVAATRELTAALARATRASLVAVPSTWHAPALADHYTTDWDGVRDLARRHLGVELRDPRVAYLTVKQVMDLDASIQAEADGRAPKSTSGYTDEALLAKVRGTKRRGRPPKVTEGGTGHVGTVA